MIQVIKEEKKKVISIKEVDNSTPIFIKKDNKLIGMITQEKVDEVKYIWVLNGGKDYLLSYDDSMHNTRLEAMNKALEEGYTLWIEE